MVTKVNYGPKTQKNHQILVSAFWIPTAHQPPATIFSIIALLSTHELIFQNWGVVSLSLVLRLAFVIGPTRREFRVYFMFYGCDLWLALYIQLLMLR